ncbi:MAG: SseB family protein [Polyangiaceae bacterium]|nr:SseB family protein [Polyangiaceae bacterium]
MPERNGHGAQHGATDGATVAVPEGRLPAAIEVARRGFRRDVQVLLDAIAEAELIVPLARPIAPPGVDRIEAGPGLELEPHVLVDSDGHVYCALFSTAEGVEHAADELGWTTDGDAFEYVPVPARAALQMALETLDDERVVGVVLDALTPAELLLRQHEVASLVAGRAIPLVGYVHDIPEQEFEKTIVAEAGDPPPPGFVAAVERAVRAESAVRSYRLDRTFNPDRDVEPHPTLTLRIRSGTDEPALAQRLIAGLGEEVPPPGYIDILFEPEPN